LALSASLLTGCASMCKTKSSCATTTAYCKCKCCADKCGQKCKCCDSCGNKPKAS
jgi:hypothetical protein